MTHSVLRVSIAALGVAAFVSSFPLSTARADTTPTPSLNEPAPTPGTRVRHHQVRARIPSIFSAWARKGARRVGSRDHGLEPEANVRAQPRLRGAERLPGAATSGRHRLFKPPQGSVEATEKLDRTTTHIETVPTGPIRQEARPRLASLPTGMTAAGAFAGISIPGNGNLQPETLGRIRLQLAPETADWRLETEIA